MLPGYDRRPRICELVRSQITDLTVKGAWTGPARLQLFEHALAPLADLPVREIVSASHILCDLTLGRPERRARLPGGRVSSPSSDEVLYEVDGHVATLTLNRPDQRNAVSPELAIALDAAVQRFERTTRCGSACSPAPGRTSAPAPTSRRSAPAAAPSCRPRRAASAGFVRYPRTKPVIAAVRGFALAGGTELVLACDLVVAGTDAQFGLPEVTRGIVAAAGGLFRLPRVLPPARAMELILTADRLGAEEAHRWGMVNAPRRAGRRARRRPRAGRPDLPQRPARRAREPGDRPRRPADRRRRGLGAQRARRWSGCATATDAREGVQAFVEKRPAQWTGR